MSYTTYEFTAYTEADLLAAGAEGHSVSSGDTFTMSGAATTCFEVSDNDAFLSGDNYCNENANDQYGQQASITGENGQEIGNGGQIYAEKYFWVCDDAGNWYVMINIEQEGSGEDYFTFYTGHGYTVPEEGTELTVYSSSNVKGSWIDFKDLDAGEKGPDTGSISGRVFNDEDCDGIDGGVTVIEGSDYTIEAEDMDAWGFKTVQGAYASGGELVKLQSAGQSAAIKTDFQGKDGVYDVSLFIQDETDGKSKIKLLVNGQVVEAIRLDRQSDGVGSNNGGFSEFVVEGVELKAGDEVKIWAEGDGYEFVRIDKLEFNGRDQEVRTEEAGKEGVVVVLLDTDGNEVLDGNGDRIETVTDANGEYTFDGVPVGDYRVKFENPDGTEFTFQNAGSDDAIDSDVNGNGVSDVISVVADQTTSDVDAGLKPAAPLPASLSGTYFCDDDGDGVDGGAANGDADVAGKIVMLFEADGMTPASDINGDPVAAQITDGQGNYSFENLAAGDYVVMFADSLDEGKTFVLQDVGGNDAIDSDVNAISGKTGVISLAAGEDKTDVDAGVEEVDPGNAGECAFFIEGPVLTKVTLEEQPDGSIKVTVDVLDSTGQIGDLRGFFFEMADESLLSQLSITGADVGEVKIDANNVTNVGSGVNVNGEVVKNFGAFDVGVEIGTPGASPDDIRSTMFTISHAGGEKLEADDFSFTDFGIRLTSVGEEGGSREDSLKIGGSAPLIICEKPGAVSGTYFCDDNRDGDDDGAANGDADVAGKTVTLLNADGTAVLDADGNVVQPVLTDATGDYRFDNIPAGDYIVMFEAVAGKEFIAPNAADDAVDSDVTDAANGKTDVITVVDGVETKDVDAGVQNQLGSLSGRYFCDENDDGAETDGAGNFEAGVAGATVWLLLQGTGVIASTTTDDDGNYIFEGLEAGNYSVRFEDPDDVSSATEGKNFIAADQADDAVDSDVVNVGGAGNGNTATITLAAGENKTDVDGGIKQQFMVCDDPDAVLIDFEGIDGDVGFEAFEAGQVIDTEYAQFGVTISAQRATNNDPANDAMVFDSANPTGGDPDLQTFNQGNLLIISEDNDSNDPDDAVGGVITFDFANPSRIFDLKVIDTEEGGTVELFDADGNSLAVIDLPNLADGGLEQVMIDTDGVSRMVVTLNGSGAIDDICIVPGQPEPGSLSGRYFFDADRDGLDNDVDNGISGIQVELLDENGVGLNVFETTDAQGNYSFGDLAAGTYGVKFTDPDTGRELTTQDVGMNDAIDSDAADVGGGMSAINGITVVAGQDTPNNDAGVVEKAGSLSGTYFCDDDRNGADDGAANGDADIANKTVMLFEADGVTQAKDINGVLVAAVLTDANGDYSFENLAAGDYVVMFEATDGKEFIAANAATDDIDSDVVDAANGKTAPVTVVAGEETKNVDAGVQDQAGSLSGTYFCDDNRDGDDDGAANGDADIAGKTVMLFEADGVTPATDIDGNLVAAAITDANGDYSFENLGAGDYVVMFEATDGKEFIAANAATDDIDSDVVDAANGKTAPVTVVAGEETKNVDAGVSTVLGSLSGRYFCDDNRDGLDNDGLNNGPSDGVEGVLVTLLDANNNPVLDGNNQPVTALTGPNGAYSFTGLIPGIYGVSFASTPPGKEFTTPNVDNDLNDDIDSDAIENDFGGADISGIEVFGGQDTPDNDVGVFPNQPPVVDPDMAKGCADELITVDFSDNFSDPDAGVGDTASITAINGQTISQGQTISVAIMNNNGETKDVSVSLTAGDQFIFDGEDAFAFLDIGEEETESFTVTVTDSIGASSQANIDVTFCGDANSAESLDASLKAAGTSVTFSVDDVANLSLFTEAYTLNLLSSTNADIPLGVFTAAYCLDSTQDIDLATLTTADVSILTEENLAAVAPTVDATKFDSINWLLNNDFTQVDNGDGTGDTYTDLEVQEAIWLLNNGDTFFINGPFPNPEFQDDGNGVRDGVEIATEQNAMEIAMAAMTQGDGFVAGDGDIIGLILDPTDPSQQDQPFVIGVAYDFIDCLF